MAMNQETQAARRYHQATKHSPMSVRQSGHSMDWANKPNPFKNYPDLEVIPLPQDLPKTGVPALEAIGKTEVRGSEEAVPELAQVAYVLYYSAGITKKMVFPGESIYFRAAACAGALYPIEIYLVCGDIPGLEAGVYHFSPVDFGLRQLRRGDYRETLARASGDETQVERAPAVLVFTAITWRSSWKYGARSYRYHFWDAGMILANCLAASAAQALPRKVVMGFVDRTVDHLLGIDGAHEKSLALLPLGWTSKPPPPAPGDIPELHLAVEPLSREQVDYPPIDEVHQASMLEDSESVKRWRESRFAGKPKNHEAERYPLRLMEASNYPDKAIENVILERGSSRRFREAAISFEELSTMLELAIAGFPADWRDTWDDLMNDLYINVHAVDNLAAGAYYLHRREKSLVILGEGDFRHHSAHLCLGQPLGGTSGATAFYLADLEAILETYGNRGYRLAQLEAGIIGGMLYLAAYALGRGATGLTFFDDDVVDFFLPASAREEAIFVTALGEPAGPLQHRGKLVRTNPGDAVKY